MIFSLKEFAKKELKEYKVIRNTGYSLRSPKGTNEELIYPMLVYKKTLKIISPNNDGIRVMGQLNGKIERKHDLKFQDIVIVDDIKYRVVEILPRIYSDFNEFTLEIIKDE